MVKVGLEDWKIIRLDLYCLESEGYITNRQTTLHIEIIESYSTLLSLILHTFYVSFYILFKSHFTLKRSYMERPSRIESGLDTTLLTVGKIYFAWNGGQVVESNVYYLPRSNNMYKKNVRTSLSLTS